MQPSIEQILSSYDDRAPLSQASTIPAAWYVDRRIAELERLSVFSKTWQLVARTDQVKTPGQFVRATVAGEPIVVVRGSDGYLRVYYERLGLRMQTWDAWVASGQKIPTTIRH